MQQNLRKTLAKMDFLYFFSISKNKRNKILIILIQIRIKFGFSEVPISNITICDDIKQNGSEKVHIAFYQ